MPVRPPRNIIARASQCDPESVARRIRSGARWQALARAVRKRQPLCCDPLSNHVSVLKPTQEVHHIIGIAKDPTQAYNPMNLVGLCITCHDDIETLILRGIDTAPLFTDMQPRPGFSATKVCKSHNNGFYCARMKTFRSTKCAGCSL